MPEPSRARRISPNDDLSRDPDAGQHEPTGWRSWAETVIRRGALTHNAVQLAPDRMLGTLVDLYELIDATLASEIETVHGSQPSELEEARAQGRKDFARALLVQFRERPELYEAIRAHLGPGSFQSRDERYR